MSDRMITGLGALGLGILFVAVRRKVYLDFGPEVVWGARRVPNKYLAALVGILGVGMIALGILSLLGVLPEEWF